MPWFNTVDVCKVLGYKNVTDALQKHVDKEDLTKCKTLTSGGKQKVNFVNESGLYSLILGSKLPNAKPQYAGKHIGETPIRRRNYGKNY